MYSMFILRTRTVASRSRSGSSKRAKTPFSLCIEVSFFFSFELHDRLELEHGDRGEHPAKNEEESQEEAEAAHQHSDLIHRRFVHSPIGGKEVAMEAGHDDDEALEPHAYVDEERGDKHDHQVASPASDPEDLGNQQVAGHHGPVSPPIGPRRPVNEGEALVDVSAVPGDEKLDNVGITYHHAREQHDLVHVLQVVNGDVSLQLEDLSGDHEQVQNHGEAGENGARDEVGGEDRRMSARQERNREVDAHDGVGQIG